MDIEKKSSPQEEEFLEKSNDLIHRLSRAIHIIRTGLKDFSIDYEDEQLLFQQHAQLCTEYKYVEKGIIKKQQQKIAELKIKLTEAETALVKLTKQEEVEIVEDDEKSRSRLSGSKAKEKFQTTAARGIRTSSSAPSGFSTVRNLFTSRQEAKRRSSLPDNHKPLAKESSSLSTLPENASPASEYPLSSWSMPTPPSSGSQSSSPVSNRDSGRDSGTSSRDSGVESPFVAGNSPAKGSPLRRLTKALSKVNLLASKGDGAPNPGEHNDPTSGAPQ
jgi:hypothetical protein